MMIYATTVTQKGQVTIPVEIRKMFSIDAKDKVEFMIEDDTIVMQPIKPLMELAGSFDVKPKFKDFNTAFKKKYGKKYSDPRYKHTSKTLLT